VSFSDGTPTRCSGDEAGKGTNTRGETRFVALQLFSGVTGEFIERSEHSTLAGTLELNFARSMGHKPSPSEVRSWQNSLFHLAIALDKAHVDQAGVVVEYRLPASSKRLDAMIVGPSADDRDRAVIVELKQWDRAYGADIDDCVTFGDDSAGQYHLHPSCQAGQYAEYLRECHSAFYGDDSDHKIALLACSFLHNANSQTCGDLLSDTFADLLRRYPLFTADHRSELGDFLHDNVGGGDGRDALRRVLESKYAPSLKLLEHTADMIEGNPVFTLLDEQQVVLNLVKTRVREMSSTSTNAVVLVLGGPGTGKSVIAVRLLAELAREGRNVVHCTGSKAFTLNMRAQVGGRAAALFKYFSAFVDTPAKSLDVLIADEAHRIRASSNTRYARRSNQPQVHEMIDAAKLSVFLLDHHQVVRPDEVGTPDLIREAATEAGADFYEIELKGQFRCSGSESYVRWLDHVLEIDGDPDLSWRNDYEFAICEGPSDLERRIQEQVAKGASGRLVAGFCWPWSKPEPDGSLVADVVIDDWVRPWNRREKGGEPANRHPYTLWATKPESMSQVGCIYSAQGFEFDYCGVIFGNDLVRRDGEWVAIKENSRDSVVKRSADLERNLRNTYRVLMSRGMKGTSVCFLDEETREYFEQQLVLPGADDA